MTYKYMLILVIRLIAITLPVADVDLCIPAV
jgi:hypothetical protein